MWFTPIRERPSLDSAALLRKVMNITDVVAASRDMGLEWFEQLLLSVCIYPQHIAVNMIAEYGEREWLIIKCESPYILFIHIVI